MAIRKAEQDRKEMAFHMVEMNRMGSGIGRMPGHRTL